MNSYRCSCFHSENFILFLMNVLVLILLISWSLVGLTVASDKFSEILATDLEILTQDFINSIKKEDSYDLQNFSKRQKRYLNKLVHWISSSLIFRSETISSQTVYQFQKKQRKCKNLKSYGIASGSNALRYPINHLIMFTQSWRNWVLNRPQNKPRIAYSHNLPKKAIMDYQGLLWTIQDFFYMLISERLADGLN